MTLYDVILRAASGIMLIPRKIQQKGGDNDVEVFEVVRRPTCFDHSDSV